MIENKEVLVLPYYETEFISDGLTLYENDINIFFQKGKFVSKDDAEGNIIISQLVPYLLFKKKNKYLVCEFQIKNKKCYSLGLYEHIYNSMKIISEKITVNAINDILCLHNISYINPYKFKFKGFIRDSLNSIDHLGCLFFTEERIKNIQVLNKKGITYSWMSIEDLINLYQDFEEWSKIIIDKHIMIEAFNLK